MLRSLTFDKCLMTALRCHVDSFTLHS